jgi:hypothetical protein
MEIEPLTDSECDWLAKALAHEIRRRAAGRVDAAGIEAAIERSNRIVLELCMAQPAAVLTDDAGDELVGVAPGFGRRSRLERLMHEFSHILMRDWVGPQIFGAETVTCHSQDNARCRHRIAARAQAVGAR